MILLDTNVLIYASDASAAQSAWARNTIAEAVSGEGAAVNAVSLAELCVGVPEPEAAVDAIRSWGVATVDVPAAAAVACAAAYRRYRKQRRRQSGKDSPATPLPDFFIGAHAQTPGWVLATADPIRIRTYFPSVRLITPGDRATGRPRKTPGHRESARPSDYDTSG